MRFAQFGPASVRGIKVDWDIDDAVDDDVRAALYPQDPSVLRPGRIRRGFVLRSHEGTLRAPKQGLVFAYPDDNWFLVQVED